MKTLVKVTRLKSPGPVAQITLRIRFAEGDPEATKYFTAVGKLVKEVLTEDEQVEFLKELRKQWSRVVKKGGTA
jgi:hypothetical protein